MKNSIRAAALIFVLQFSGGLSGLARADDSKGRAVFSDREVMGILSVANDGDIDAAKVAKDQGSSAQVKDFAERMINDHKNSNEQTKSLAKRLKLNLQDTDASKELKSKNKGSVAQLKELRGPSFDREYLSHEISYHQSVLDMIDHSLSPQATRSEVKDLLGQTRSAIVSHLEQARNIQKDLSGESAK